MPVQTYTVKGGDNLFSIAGNVYGDQKMFAEIMRLNGLSSGVIRPGMVLRLPAPKPSSAINVSYGLMNAVKAENAFVQQNKRMPTEEELKSFIQTPTGTGGTPLVNTNVDLLRQQRQERNMLMAEQAQQAPTQRSNIATNRPTPALTQAQQAEASAFTPEARAAYGARYGQQPTRPFEFTPGEFSPYATMGYSERLGDMYTTRENAESSRQKPRPLLSYLLPGLYQTKSPWEMSVAHQNKLAAPKPPATTYRGQQLRSQLETVPIGAESALNLTRANLSKPLPDFSTPEVSDPKYLSQIGMTPPQINYFLNTINKPNLTQQEADQFRAVFNIPPGSQFDQDIQNTVVPSSIAPSTNEELMGSIWQELQYTGGYGMPTEWIIGGGGGGNGGGGQGNKRSPYSIGGTATYGGF